MASRVDKNEPGELAKSVKILQRVVFFVIRSHTKIQD